MLSYREAHRRGGGVELRVGNLEALHPCSDQSQRCTARVVRHKHLRQGVTVEPSAWSYGVDDKLERHVGTRERIEHGFARAIEREVPGELFGQVRPNDERVQIEAYRILELG